jgi:hypothetical protein
MARRTLSPAGVAWLIGVGLIGFRWASPLAGVYTNAILADAAFGVAALLFALECVRARRWPQWRRWHTWLAGFVGLTALAALAAPDRTLAMKTLLLVIELAVLAVLSAELASEVAVPRLLGRVTLVAIGLTTCLSLIALVLFYAGHSTDLLGSYGEQFTPSKTYARVRAGFESPPLLASWCIAASAILAWGRAELPRRWRIAGQVALGFLVVATLSRAVLAFAAAIVIRWAYRSRQPRRKLIAAASVAAVVAVLAALTVGRLHVDPAEPSATSYHVPDPGNRREAAVTAWHTFKEHPLLGSGPGSYPGQNRGEPFRAHLTPLNIAATTGLPALLAVTGMLVALWRGRSRPTDVAIWSGLLALGLDGLAQDIDHFRHVWLLVGLAAVHAGTQPPRRFATEAPSGEVLSTH